MQLHHIKNQLLKLLLVFVASVTAVAATAGSSFAAGSASMYVTQVNPMVVGSTFTVQVRVNTGGAHVNAVEADFTYPTNLLSFVSVDDASLSAFELNVSATGGSGSVAIARGTTVSGGQMGDLKVANVTFNVLAAGTANVTFQNSSALDDVTTNTNDLGTMTDGQFTNVAGLAAGQTLASGGFVKSSNGYLAIMQTDGNFVVYNPAKQAVWNTKTAGNPGAHAIMQTDGNFVVYSKSNKALWNARTNWYPGSNAVMQTDGNFVIYDSYGRALWSRTTSAIYGMLLPGQTLTPGDFLKSSDEQYRAIMQTDGNFVVYNTSNKALWNTRTAGNPGAWAIMQTDGNFVVYNPANRALWNSQTPGHPGAHAILQTDANFVVYASSNKALWSWRTGKL